MNPTKTQVDKDALNLAHAIALTESDNGSGSPNYNAKGPSGEHGAYQWMPGNYENAAKKYGFDPSDFSPTTQDKVAYYEIKDYKDKGYKPHEIASIWNSGSPQNYQNHSGTNSQGVKYDTPAYVNKVKQNYLKLTKPSQESFNPKPYSNPSGAKPGQFDLLGTETANGNETSQPSDPNAPDTYGATFKASTKGEGDNTLVYAAREGLKSLGNVPSSTYNLGKGLVNIGLHPIKTIEGIGNAFAGGIEEGWYALTGGKANNTQTQTFDALKKALYDRYGSLENAKRSATNDPVGVGSDILAILEGGAHIADKFAGAGISTKGLIGDELLSAQKANSPIQGALNSGLLKVAQPVVLGLKTAVTAPFKAIGHALGLETGVGYDPIRQGLEASQQGGESMKAFTEGLRGNNTPEQLVDKAKNALGEIVDTRSQAYKDMLSKLGGNKTAYDISPVQKELGTQLDKFKIKTPDVTIGNHLRTVAQEVDNLPTEEINKLGGIGKLLDANKSDIVMQLQSEGFDDLANQVAKLNTNTIKNVGDYANKVQSIVNASPSALDFSRSKFALDLTAQKDIANLVNYVKNYGSKAGDTSALGIDNLKQIVGSYYSPNSDYRAFTQGIKNSIWNPSENTGVMSQVPGYKGAMANYADMTDNIKDITKSLSLGDKASVETAFKKLTSALKNNDFRLQVVQGLDKDTGGQLLSSIAGQRLSSVTPRGLAGVLEGGAGVLTAISHPEGILPLLGVALTTSPRVVGEFIRALGLGTQGVLKLNNILSKFSMPAVLGGNLINRVTPGILNNAGQTPNQ